PALRAIREKFPRARITVAVGKPGAPVVELSGYADATLPVDRVALRDGPKPWAILRIIRLVQEVRSKEFDFVIDLHSLSETNMLGFLSGAQHRLYARRPGRSLDFLGRFHARPPVEDAKEKHAVDRYLDVLVPLGIRDAQRKPRLRARSEDYSAVEAMLKKAKADMGVPLMGLFPGAGHPSRRWPLARFSELADMLTRNDEVRIIVFAGPEESEMVAEVKSSFPRSTIVLDRLTIPQLAAAMSRLSVLVSNDTGPMHVAAAVGTNVVLLLDRRAPHTYLPVEGQHRIIQRVIGDIPVEEVYASARELLVTGRTEALFAT
ncbi:MAG: glycosyltransferase family 9 protein, partial [Acidobacteria bacterium]|nr:glycosyltransferase family 9 protein [Acidobacteriota bacterium]